MAWAAFSSSMRSPTFTGMYVKTVPASVRCTRWTRMSLMTNESKASAGREAVSAQAAARRRPGNRGRFKRDSAREQAIDVVVEGKERKGQEQREPESLPDLHRPFGNGAALHDFREIIHQVPTIEQRNRQEIQHAQAHAHEGEEAQPRGPPGLRRLSGIVGDRDGTGEVLPRNVADDHAPEHLDGEYREVPDLRRGLRDRGDRVVAHDRRHALELALQLRRDFHLEAPDAPVP